MDPVRSHLLEELGRKHRATKFVHGYLRRYSELFEQRREKVRSILEIGVQEGGSLRMWEEYFPNATICGLDVDPSYAVHQGERRIVFIGDSTLSATANRIREEHPALFDIIIDDGSHHPADQLDTFEAFFPLLGDGGYYAIEDIGHTRGPLRLVVNAKLAELIEGINFWPRDMSAAELSNMRRFETGNPWIDGVVGARFFRGLTIIEKGANPGEIPAIEDGRPGEKKRKVRRPRLRTSRLRELRWPGRFRGRRFIRSREVRPEPQSRLLVRWLMRRW